MTVLTLYSRPGCHLCDDMAAELAPILREAAATLTVVDVDTDAALRERYGLRVPVLVLDGEVIAEARLDHDAVRDALGIA